MNIYTIGYEGQNLVSFGAALEGHKIRRIVDVREIPLSHKAGFSKTRLAEFLRTISVDYIHLPALGCPKDIRHEYRVDHDWERYKTRYLAYLATREKEVGELLGIVQEMPSCLMCFEADQTHCHRFFIATRLTELSQGKLVVTPIVPVPTGS
jgi:uncharacterized protein (DUF488 family)